MKLDRKFCVAPMMDWTDRHCRFFHRLLTRRALLYTEMVTTGAVIHGDRARLLGFDQPSIRSHCSLAAPTRGSLRLRAHRADLGYDEINLNVGCPSDRVQEGRFGACLMAEPPLVADCVAAMQRGVDPRHRQMPHRHRRAGPRRRWQLLREVSTGAADASSCMRARPGSRACRRKRTAKCRLSIMPASIA